MNLKNLLIGIGVGGGLIAGIGYWLRLKRTSIELETFATVMVDKLDFSGLTLRVDLQIKNPTKTKFNIKFPFVKLFYKNTSIGSSEVIDKDIQIPGFGEAVVEKIMLRLPLNRVLNVTTALINSLQSNEAVKITSKTITTIDIGWKQIPYEKTQEIILKN